MSINLHCKQVELYQTPTYISKICYYTYNLGDNKSYMPGNYSENTHGEPFEIHKDNWVSIREKYILWLLMHYQDVANLGYQNMKNMTEQQQAEEDERIKSDRSAMYDHIRELRTYGKLDFEIM